MPWCGGPFSGFLQAEVCSTEKLSSQRATVHITAQVHIFRVERTTCPRRSCQLYIVTYFKKWVTTSWIYSLFDIHYAQEILTI